MKKVFSVMLVVVMTMASVLSLKLAYSQSEEETLFWPFDWNCLCTDAKGRIINYGEATTCQTGGTLEECENVECPDPPAACGI